MRGVILSIDVSHIAMLRIVAELLTMVCNGTIIVCHDVL